MTDIIFIKSSLLAKYVSKAIDIDAFEIEIECRDGYEEIIAMRNQKNKNRGNTEETQRKHRVHVVKKSHFYEKI